jgi:hypothetical protein
VAAFAQREIFDNVQVLYILSKGLMLSWCLTRVENYDSRMRNFPWFGSGRPFQSPLHSDIVDAFFNGAGKMRKN